MVYNDSLAFLTSTAALAASVVFVVRGPSAVRLGAVTATAGLAALTRASGLLVAGVAGLAVVLGMWRATQGSTPRRLGRAAIWAGAVGAANLWVWWRYLDIISITDRPGLLVAVIPLLLVGLGLQALALWRLEPEAVHPGRPATPRWSPAWRGELNQRDVAELSGTRTSRTFGEE